LVFTLLREARIGAVSERASHRFLFLFCSCLGLVGVVGFVVGFIAGLLLFKSSRVLFWLNSLALLTTVRGGTSFLCQTATKKRSKENALQPLILKCPERAVFTVWYFRKTLSAVIPFT
jgi:hypothetical protein